MSENKQELQYLEGYYMGREFVKSGTKQDGTKWSLFKTKFKEKMEDQYLKQLSCFDSAKGFEDLSEGEYFLVGYTESEPKYNEKAKKEIKYKTAVWFKKKDENEETEIKTERPAQPAEQPKQEEKEPSKLDADKEVSEEEDTFIKEVYTPRFEDDDEANEALFISAYMSVFAPAAIARAKKLYEVNFR